MVKVTLAQTQTHCNDSNDSLQHRLRVWAPPHFRLFQIHNFPPTWSLALSAYQKPAPGRSVWGRTWRCTVLIGRDLDLDSRWGSRRKRHDTVTPFRRLKFETVCGILLPRDRPCQIGSCLCICWNMKDYCWLVENVYFIKVQNTKF